MKTRVLYRSGFYYPQTEGMLWGWNYLTREGFHIAFKEIDEAVDFLKAGKYSDHNKVVWESE